MNTKKIVRSTLVLSIFSFLLIQPALSQTMNYSELEQIQDEIEHLYAKTYTIFEAYPHVTYEYIHDGDHVDAVRIFGTTDEKAKKRLEVYLMDIAELENRILNKQNRTGVFYVTETEPKPEGGLEAFHEDLRTYIEYPAINTLHQTKEGTLYAKFVVDSQGEIGDVIFTSNFEDKDNVQVEALKKETEEAIQLTSGEWKPAEVAGVPVSEWVVIPVQFDLKEDYYSMMW